MSYGKIKLGQLLRYLDPDEYIQLVDESDDHCDWELYDEMYCGSPILERFLDSEIYAMGIEKDKTGVSIIRVSVFDWKVKDVGKGD